VRTLDLCRSSVLLAGLVGGVTLVGLTGTAGCTGESGVIVYNAPPTAAILSPQDGLTVDENIAITFEGRVSDDGDPLDLEIQWLSDKDGELSTSVVPDPDGRVELVTANLSDGNHAISLRVVDAQGEQGAASIQVTINDLPDPPDIEITAPTNGDPPTLEGEDYEFRAVVEDAQDEPTELEVVFVSDVDGFLCEGTPALDGVVACLAEPSVGAHRITAEVEDTDGNTDADDVFMTIQALADHDNDGDGFTPNQGDCNDDNDAIFPGADEQPNEIDDDCDGTVDEGTINYDDDGDGFSEVDGDCDDTNRLTYPGASEVEDGEDNDCDKTIDEGTRVYDDDGDGYSEVDGDCNDSKKEINPSATETCDGVDNDCDTTVDEEGSVGCATYYADNDKDSYGHKTDKRCLCAAKAPHTATNNRDCYDSNPSAKPGASGWFGVDRGDGSFDYNCDGSATRRWTATFDCWGGLWVCGVDRDGWDGGVPSCGVSRRWGTDCKGESWGCSAKGSSRQQTCR